MSDTDPITIESLYFRPSAQAQVRTPGQQSHNIAVIYTGGTIGMVPGPNGLTPGDDIARRLMKTLQTLPEERLQALSEFDLLTLPRLIDSSNATPEDWLYLSRVIRDHSAYYEGFIVLHGTDTLAYTASALSFLLPLSLPVLVTGSQYPLEANNSDALSNVESALLTLQRLTGTTPDTAPLYPACGLIVFGGQILQGNRATKFSTYAAEGFTSINKPVLGHCRNGQLTLPAERQPLDNQESPFSRAFEQHQPVSLPEVVILKLWPGIQARQIESLLAEPVKGVILESYGSGNAPDLNQPLLKALKDATDRGVVIVNRSQCPQGSVSMNYAAGSALTEAGVISGFDMTCEAAFSKLTLLLSLNTDIPTIKADFARNYCAELSVY